MTTHWLHVTLSWGITALVFGGLAVGAYLRQRAAKARLAQLDPRGARDA
ncbi:heme exporter protein CcmD [Falsiroseomonas oryziterrae]|nr:heme exporter protein CcmD [Roseomonas sp. NPKOSM-4]